ncbi:CpaD family pilus assembly protein [Propylenella binzhouense]|uniref:Pilus assembly protein CpaD n=1 Tax=Propylenella binzhouense TaxID=2555902 RepID=A0A964T778_9HYPH|nr:CpaD family pilus assembly protein [Propylenella binzhouense]MYZ48672.1 pilus assembly protein CpaD [Propylenella binzhouense]
MLNAIKVEAAAGRRRAAGLLAAALLAGGLAGCNTADDQRMAYFDNDYRIRHPIVISNEPATLDLPVGMRGGALSGEFVEAIHNYVADYRESGTGGITIQVPTGSANEIAAAQTGSAVNQVLVQAGVSPAAIQVAPYAFGDRRRMAPLRLSFLKVQAVTPRCGVWPRDVSPTFADSTHYNFGCAGQQNLAAMVANPADLVQPRAEQPANGARRAKVVTDYQQGAETKSSSTLIDYDLNAE